MPDLSFEIVSARPARDMITPAISFDLRVTNRFPEQLIHAVLLRCQIQIEVARRRYSSSEQDQLASPRPCMLHQRVSRSSFLTVSRLAGTTLRR